MDEADAAATAKKGAAHLGRGTPDAALLLRIVFVSGGAAAAMDSRHDLSAVESAVFGGTAVAERRSSF